MPTITIRNLDSNVKDKLKVMAAHHSRSMESEVRSILKHSVMAQNYKTPQKFGQKITLLFNKIAVELELPERTFTKEPPSF